MYVGANFTPKCVAKITLCPDVLRPIGTSTLPPNGYVGLLPQMVGIIEFILSACCLDRTILGKLRLDDYVYHGSCISASCMLGYVCLI